MLLAMAMLPMGAWAQATVTWDFTQALSSNDVTAFAQEDYVAASGKDWVSTTEGSKEEYSTSNFVLHDDYLKVGATVLEKTDGLKFHGVKNRFLINNYTGKYCIQVKAADAYIIIPGLKAGYKVEMVYKAASGTDRYFEPTNLTYDDSADDKDGWKANGTTQITATGTVTADGAVLLTCKGGTINVHSITVKDESDNVLSIAEVKALYAVVKAEPTTYKEWDFTKTISEDLTSYGWASSGSVYNYNTAIAQMNEVDLFSGTSLAGLLIGKNSGEASTSTFKFTNGKRLNLNGQYTFIRIPGLKAGDKVAVNFSAAGSSERYLSIINGTAADAATLMSNATSDVKTAVITIDNNDALTITCATSGMYFYSIKVYKAVILNGSGYGTMSYGGNVKVTGADAYKAELNTSAKTITCTKIADGKVPAGAGVLLYGDAQAKVVLEPISESLGELAGNDLIGTTKADGSLMAKDAGKYQYVLSGETFKHFTGTAFTPGKAYFETDAAVSAPNFNIEFSDGNTTGISEALNVKSQDDATTPVYNLAGQRVANPTKGLYIVNGKKVVIK